MMCNPSWVLIVSLGICMSCAESNSSRKALPNARNVVATTYSQNDDYNNNQLDKLVRDLRSDNENERAAAKKTLLEISGKSMAARDSVIRELLKIIKAPRGSVEFMKHPTRYLEWKGATEILGSIKAIEAIDDLIECLDCNIGAFGLSPDVFPATRSIIKIGAASIPKLSEAVEQKPLLVRYLAAVALSQIGGDRAKSVLYKAMQKEKDKDISSAMNNLLKNWDGSNRYHP